MQAHVIHTRKRHRGKSIAAVAAIALAAGVPWWLFAPDAPSSNDTPVPLHAETAPLPPARPSAPIDLPARPLEAAAEPMAAAPTCPHQRLEVTVDKEKATACTSATRTRQNGSLRSFSVAAEGLSRWSLRVDTAGGRIVSARLSKRAEGREPAAEFSCAAEHCTGFEVGAPDAHGKRLLQVRSARLAAAAARAGSTTIADVALSAQLQIAPDRQNPALACAMRSVDVVMSDGGTVEFCPAGGAGFELNPEGHTDYVFHDLEGRRLAVTLAADGTVLRAAYGSLACEGNRCGSIVVQVLGDPGSPASQRQFRLSGTFVADPRRPGSGATINGELVMPAQE